MHFTRTRRIGILTIAAMATAMGAGGAAYGAVAPDGGGGGTGGTDGPDRLVGGPGGDQIRARAGDDRVYSRRGPDEVHGGAGADRVYAGRGNDRVFGGAGADRLFGEKGADRIQGNEGADVIFVGAGRDWAHGGKGNDVIYAKARRDIDGRRDREGDQVFGGEGDDVIDARDGERDLVGCGPGRDRAVIDFKDQIANPAGTGACEQVDRAAAKSKPSASRGTRINAVRWALSQLGVQEQPLGSNRGPKIDAWSRRVGMLGVPWCGIFVHESFLVAGRDLHNATASTDFIRASAESDSEGYRAIALGKARRGDLVLLDFPGGDGDDHVAIVTRGLANGQLRTVDGNSSDRVKRNSYSTSSIAMAVRVTR